MANFLSYDIPARRTKSARVRTYQRLKGVDFSSDEAQVALQRSPNSLNMYKNYSVELGQCVETRPGFRRQVVFPEKEDNTVYGQLFFENRTKTVTKIQPLFHVGDTLYLWESYPQKADTLDETGQNPGLSALYTGLCCQDSAMMVFDGKVYFLDGAHYHCFDGETVQEVKSLALVPTTYIGRDPLGGGTQYQQRNLLQDAFINTFLSDGKSQDYYLSMTDIDEVVRVEVDGRTLSADEYTVDAEEGKVTFTNVPPAPQTPGQDTVLIEAKKHTDGYAARIETCRVMAVFDNRLFCAGNPETPNVVYFSQRNDPTYFGEITYETDGKEPTAVVGFMRIGSQLAAIKEESEQEATVFLHQPVETNIELSPKSYPADQGLSGLGAAGRRMCLNFLDDPVFLTTMGLKAIGKLSIASERSIEHRSSLVDGRLVNEKGLANAQLCAWRGYLICLVDGRMYLADSRQTYVQAATGHTEYEWYFWDNIGVYDGSGAFRPAVSVLAYKDQLYIGTDNGVVLTFNTDRVNNDSGELSAEAYTDDGRPIFWCWTTPFDALGQPNRVKRDNKRGGVLELKSMSHGQVKGKVRTNRAPWKEFVRVDGGYFDFTDLNFADLSFATEEKSLVSFQSKQKRWVKKQLMFYGDEAGRPGGLYAITMEAFLAGYYR